MSKEPSGSGDGEEAAVDVAEAIASAARASGAAAASEGPPKPQTTEDRAARAEENARLQALVGQRDAQIAALQGQLRQCGMDLSGGHDEPEASTPPARSRLLAAREEHAGGCDGTSQEPSMPRSFSSQCQSNVLWTGDENEATQRCGSAIAGTSAVSSSSSCRPAELPIACGAGTGAKPLIPALLMPASGWDPIDDEELDVTHRHGPWDTAFVPVRRDQLITRQAPGSDSPTQKVHSPTQQVPRAQRLSTPLSSSRQAVEVRVEAVATTPAPRPAVAASVAVPAAYHAAGHPQQPTPSPVVQYRSGSTPPDGRRVSGPVVIVTQGSPASGVPAGGAVPATSTPRQPSRGLVACTTPVQHTPHRSPQAPAHRSVTPRQQHRSMTPVQHSRSATPSAGVRLQSPGVTLVQRQGSVGITGPPGAPWSWMTGLRNGPSLQQQFWPQAQAPGVVKVPAPPPAQPSQVAAPLVSRGPPPGQPQMLAAGYPSPVVQLPQQQQQHQQPQQHCQQGVPMMAAALGPGLASRPMGGSANVPAGGAPVPVGAAPTPPPPMGPPIGAGGMTFLPAQFRVLAGGGPVKARAAPAAVPMT